MTGNTVGSFGGGIHNGGTVMLQTGSRVTGNASTFLGGGIFLAGGGTVTLQTGSRVTDNTASRGDGYGGGIYSVYGTVSLETGSMICSNTPLTSQCSGGGVSGTCPNPSDGICPI